MLAVLTMQGFSPRLSSGTAARVTRNRPAHVDGEHAVPLLDGDGVHVLGRRGGRGAGIVDQHFEAAELGVDLLEHGAHGRIVGDIAGEQEHFRARLPRFGGHLARGIRAAAVVEPNIVAGAGEMEHGGPADARRPAGDKRPFAPIHGQPFVLRAALRPYLCE